MPTRSSCPLCTHDSVRVFEARGHGILQCTTCGHQFADFVPDPSHANNVYGNEYFWGGGAGYADYLADASLLRARGRRYAALVRQHRVPGRVLDVGAAAGFLLAGFTDAGWQGVGIEPNARMAAHGRDVLGLDLRPGTLESFTDLQPFDLVTMVQVLPHFHDLPRALATAAAVTRPGGHWLIETWDRSSLAARAFGPGWHEYSPPSVLHWFSRHGLSQYLRGFGMIEVASRRTIKWISGAHVKSSLRHASGGGALAALAALVPDRLVLPYPGDDLFWMLLRKDGSPPQG